MKNCTPLWREAHCQAKMSKAYQVRTIFGSYDVEKVHAVVARSAFRSQHVESTPGSDHFWKLRCRKSACRCGAKHISNSKCTNHTIVGPLLEVEMSKVHAFDIYLLYLVNISTYCINLLILKYICLFLRFSCFICVDTTISVTRIPWAKGLRDLQAWMAVMMAVTQS